MKSGSGGLKLIQKKEKNFLERAKEAIGKKLKSLFAGAADADDNLDFTQLICRLPSEVIEVLRKIQAISDITKSDDYSVEGIGLSGSGGICHRVIYKTRFIFIIKKIDLTFFRDRDYLRLERELNIQNSLSHERIPQLYHSFLDNNGFYLVMQYSGENLENQSIESREDILSVCPFLLV